MNSHHGRSENVHNHDAEQGHLRVLCLEDSPQDSEIIREMLVDAGYEVDFTWTAQEEEYVVQLRTRTFDIVLSDFRLPGFDAFGALSHANAIAPNVPFVCVSGSIGEETAIELLKKGAVDYILKDRLSRLPFAVKRALEEAQQKEARKQAEQVLRESEAKYGALVNYSLDAIFLGAPDGRILAANPAACELFERSEQAICELRREEFVDVTDPRLTAALEQRERTGSYRGELTFLHRDGTPFPCEVSSAIFMDGTGQKRTSVMLRDVTERVRAEDQIRASLREKEILLKEIHHRVKNNMQLISSMLSMECRRATDGRVRDVFGDTMNRIRTMALVHERLYQSGSLAAIEFKEFLGSLASDLQKYHSVHGVSTVLEAEEVSLGIDAAIPCGLIVNELVSNAFKHAFAGLTSGRITIRLRRLDGGTAELRVEDDGVGFPQGIEIHKPSSMGMTLVTLLVQQIDGTIQLERDGGTRFVVAFPDAGNA